MFQIIDKWHFNFFTWFYPSNYSLSQSVINKNEAQRTTNAFSITMLWIWIFLYFIYEKCLHLLFRRLKYPMIFRRRIIDGLWCSGFALSSMFYLKYFIPESLDSACHLQRPRYLELGFTLHKSIYLHRAIIEIFNHGNWLQGWTNVIFCLIIHSSSEQKWFDVVTKLLFYKASVIALINITRIMASLKDMENRNVIVKFLLGFYFMNWFYVGFIVIPDFQRWNTQGMKNDWLTLICMWIWLLSEFFSEISHIRIVYKNSSHWLEAYLFSPPTREMIELKNICKKLRDTSSSDYSEVSDKKKMAELWQTISCAMVMKKKIRRIREGKANLELSNK